MNSYKSNYLQACKDRNVVPNDGVIRIIKESNKLNYLENGEPFLNFSGCNLSVSDCQLLSKCFATDDLVQRYLFTDCLLSEDVCKVTLNAFMFNKSLTVLDLKGNNLRNSGAHLVGKLLKRTMSLTELYLEWNTLGMWDDGITAIAEGLALNRSLQVLDLSNNQISHEGGQEIASSLKQNRVLRTLDMRWNNIGVIGGRAFLSSLNHNKYLVNLALAGNNIPSDTLKAIATAMQRNVDYHSIYEEHQSMARSLKQEIDHLQHEKSLQVSTLVNQLEKEKELHENMTETTRDRLDQMKVAIEDLKKENLSLQGKNESYEKELLLKEKKIRELQVYGEETEARTKQLSAKYASEYSDLTEELHQQQKLKKQEDLERESHVFELQKTIGELKDKVEDSSSECMALKNTMKKNKTEFESDKIDYQERISREKEEFKSESSSKIKSLSDKVSRYEKDKERLDEEVGRLKSNLMSEKLRHEDELVAQRTKLKQNEILQNKQYEQRIDLLINTKDELQMKISKLSVEVSDTHTQYISCQKDLETYKRQSEQQQQLLNQRDLEYRNETNRLRIEIDNEKRKNSELSDQIRKAENQHQDLLSQLRELKSVKEAEVSKLQDIIKSKEDDIKRTREDELRRAGMLENALQTYITSTRTAYK